MRYTTVAKGNNIQKWYKPTSAWGTCLPLAAPHRQRAPKWLTWSWKGLTVGHWSLQRIFTKLVSCMYGLLRGMPGFFTPSNMRWTIRQVVKKTLKLRWVILSTYWFTGLQVYNIYSFKPHSSYFINFIEIVWKKICSTTFNFLVYRFTGLQLMYFINYDNYNCIIHNFGLQVYRFTIVLFLYFIHLVI